MKKLTDRIAIEFKQAGTSERERMLFLLDNIAYLKETTTPCVYRDYIAEIDKFLTERGARGYYFPTFEKSYRLARVRHG